MAEIRKINLSNEEIIPFIDCVTNDYSVKRENMIGKFNIQSMGETSFSEKIEIYGKTKGYIVFLKLN